MWPCTDELSRRHKHPPWHLWSNNHLLDASLESAKPEKQTEPLTPSPHPDNIMVCGPQPGTCKSWSQESSRPPARAARVL